MLWTAWLVRMISSIMWLLSLLAYCISVFLQTVWNKQTEYLVRVSVEVKILQETSGEFTEQEIVCVIDGPQAPVCVVIGAGAGTERTHWDREGTGSERKGGVRGENKRMWQRAVFPENKNYSYLLPKAALEKYIAHLRASIVLCHAASLSHLSRRGRFANGGCRG